VRSQSCAGGSCCAGCGSAPRQGTAPAPGLLKALVLPATSGRGSGEGRGARARVRPAQREGASLQSCPSSSRAASRRQRGRGHGPGASRREQAGSQARRGARPPLQGPGWAGSGAPAAAPLSPSARKTERNKNLSELSGFNMFHNRCSCL